MKYNEILKQISIKENVPVKQIEQEMKTALKAAGITCSVKEFIQRTSIAVKDYI